MGAIGIGEISLAVGDLGYQGTGSSSLHLRNIGVGPARVLLLGGTPFTEQLVMWWNFVGRSHDEIAGYRQLWEDADERFGAVESYRGPVNRLPAPPLPTARLRPR
jgi:quercetin 2,3-dioxygenase